MKTDQRFQKEQVLAFMRNIARKALLLIPALIYLPTFGGNAAVPPGESVYSDLLITHYPYLLYLRESLITNQQIPLWSTLIQSGAPFAANPLAGVFYLPGWIGMVFPLPAGLSLVLALHMVFGTFGMYKFLRHKKTDEIGSLLGALGFGLMPKLAAHFGAGHVTLIYAISWTPWLLYCSERDRRGWITGVVAGLLFLADPRWAVYGGMLWVSYKFAYRQLQARERVLYYLKSSLIAFLISAPLLLPLMEYLRHATRANLEMEDIFYGSLPVSNLIGLIIPGSGGNIEWYLYAGGVLLALIISQFFNKDLRKRNRFWVLWTGISLLLALGSWGVKADWVSSIPLLNILRVPARSLFLTGICLAVIGGTSLESILNGFEDPKKRRILFGICVAGIFTLLGLAVLKLSQSAMIFWGFAFFTAAGLLLLVNSGKAKIPLLGWIILGVLVVDLLGAGYTSYHIQSSEAREPNPAQTYLIEDDGNFRIYSPSYSVQQYLAAEYQLELADGVDPMQIAKYVEFSEKATGVYGDGYSVTIPAFKTGNPSLDNINAIPNSMLLGLLNVKYVISEFAIDAPGLTLLSNDLEPFLYLNERMMPRAWIEELGEKQGDLDLVSERDVRILEKSANKIILEAAGPGVLVTSEVDYPGWRVYVDGKREELISAYGVLRSVELSAGNHQVVFRFHPVSVYAGLILAGIGWSIIVYQFLRNRFEELSD